MTVTVSLTIERSGREIDVAVVVEVDARRRDRWGFGWIGGEWSDSWGCSEPFQYRLTNDERRHAERLAAEQANARDEAARNLADDARIQEHRDGER